MNKEVCSHDWRKRRENNRSNQLDNMELGQGPDLDKDIEKCQCCGKQFTTLRGLKIHQGKVCRKKGEIQQRRLHSHETSGETPLDRNHNGSKTTVKPRRKKVKWPKACDAAEYQEFVRRHKGNIEQKLKKLAETIYNEGEKRFGLEVNNITTPRQNKEILPRRQKKLQRVKKEKKQLHNRWIEAKEEEKEGLKILYEEVKKKHRDLLRKERNIKCRKEKERTRKEFIKDPYKFSKSVFTESKSGTLKCTKEVLESHKGNIQ